MPLSSALEMPSFSSRLSASMVMFVAVLHHGQRATIVGFWRDVPDHKSVCAAGLYVGNKRHVVAEAGTHDGARGTKHLSHARAALGSFVTDHDHIPFLILPARIAFMAFSSESNGRAVPVKLGLPYR